MEKTKKAPAKKTAVAKKETKETKLNSNVVDYSSLLKKILICLYILIALATICTVTYIVRVTTNGSNKTNETLTTEENEDYDVSMFKSIEPKEFIKLTKSEDTKVVYFGRSTCGYCVKFLPNLQKAQEELGYKTYYVDIANIETSSDEYNDMLSLIDGMAEKYNKDNGTDYESLYGYTPTIALVKDGKIQNIWIGYSEYDAFISWLNENGVK